MNSRCFARRLIRTIFATALWALSLTGAAWAQSPAPPPPLASATAGTTKMSAQRQAQITWQQTLLAQPSTGPGCFEAHFPDKAWRKVACVTAPNLPMGKLSATPIALRPAGKQGVKRASIGGSGTDSDYMATVDSGYVIDSAQGSFANVSGLKTLSSTSATTWAFSLQLNSNVFTNTVAGATNSVPGCASAPNPNICQGWEQFAYLAGKGGDTGTVFIEYWALHYLQENCPPSWKHFDGPPESCFFSSPAATVPNQALANFDQLALSGFANKGGQDVVTLVAATGMYRQQAYDSVLNLATNWNAEEFNVFGGDNSAEANFNPGVSIDVHLGIVMSPQETVSCAVQSTTGEATNLYIDSPCTVAPAGNEIHFTEGNGPNADAPLILDNTPTIGPADGRDLQITLTGFHLAAATQVTFNGTPIPIISSTGKSNTSNLDTILAGPIPPCSTLGCASGPGALITATSPAGTGDAPFLFLQLPVISKITPNPGGAGSTITVSGNGFYGFNGTSTPVFYFGGVPAQNVYCPGVTRNTHCTMTAPPGNGSVIVLIGDPTTTNNSKTFSSPSDETFTYFGAPTVTQVTPSSGSVWGGTKVILHGTGFTQNMQAGFGDSFADMQNGCPTSTECTVTTQASKHPTSPGLVNVVVANLDGTNMSAPGPQFNYEPYPRGYMQPSAGPPAGGTTVVVAGMNLGPSPIPIFNFNFNGNQTQTVNATCKTVPPGVNAEIQETCTFVSPPLTPAGNSSTLVNVTATVNGMTSSIGGFTYVTPTPPGETCSQCVASGGICSKSNGKFICKCQKSSPTGQCE